MSRDNETPSRSKWVTAIVAALIVLAVIVAVQFARNAG